MLSTRAHFGNHNERTHHAFPSPLVPARSFFPLLKMSTCSRVQMLGTLLCSGACRDLAPREPPVGGEILLQGLCVDSDGNRSFPFVVSSGQEQHSAVALPKSQQTHRCTAVPPCGYYVNHILCFLASQRHGQWYIPRLITSGARVLGCCDL